MRFLGAMLVVMSAAPALVEADVTIRYRIETSSPMAPAANRSTASVIYMKGNKGVTVGDGEITIVDLARQEVTMIDTVRRKYATLSAADYSKQMGQGITDMMPQTPGMADMFKSMKTTCTTKDSDTPETIQGVQALERDINCVMTISMPDNMKAVMPAMNMNFVMRVWSAAQAERTRVPGLWQLSGFELWQKYFMNPTGALGKMAEAMKPMEEAMQAGQSATLRSSMEMSMKMPMAGMPAGDTPFMKMNQEVVGLSTELLDDSLFTVPGDCSPEPLGPLMKGITAALMASSKLAAANGAQPAGFAAAHQTTPETAKLVIPENVKAYVPSLAPLTETQPVLPAEARASKLHGSVAVLITVGSKGNVEKVEALNGPEVLRKAAIATVAPWTFRPVIRGGVPVTAYTDADVVFAGESEEPAKDYELDAGMTDAWDRLSQLEEALPRSPELEFADREQDAGGNDKARRYHLLDGLAVQAAEVGANDKAKTYAGEFLAAAEEDAKGWNYGNAIHDGHMVLGLVALRQDDVVTARSELLEAGKTPGSPQLGGFGPNMALAGELLKKGERQAVLDYLELCRKFWKTGAAKLDAWSDTIRSGGTPDFGGKPTSFDIK